MSNRKRIGRYEILSELGRGAMGVVFKARDPHIGRLVALKTITAGVAEDPDLMERFYQEAKTAGALQHPNVVIIYEMAEADGSPFIAMEYLEGENLDQLILRQAPPTVAQKLGIIVQACHALDYAHQRGIIHRDIKPGNIMVTRDGVIKVVDFGIARLANLSKTQTGTMLGTLAYMSPQQFRGKRADAQSDVWSIGVVLYELLTGQKPFAGESQAALLLNILQCDPPPIRSFLPDVPEALERIVQKALQKEDVDRYPSVEALLFELEPVWASERDKTSAQLLRNARDLIAAQRLSESQEALNQCLQVDRSNLAAKSLLEEVNAHLGVSTTSARIRWHIVQGKALLKEGLFADAREEAESALKLDASDPSALSLLQSVESEQSRARQEQTQQKAYVDQQMRAMKASLERGELSQAIELGKTTLARVGADPGLSQLVRFAERERQSREARAGVDQQVRKIAQLLKEKAFTQAQNEIRALQAAAPDDRRIPELMAAANERRPLSASANLQLVEADAPSQRFAREYVFQSASPGAADAVESVGAHSAATTVRFPSQDAPSISGGPTRKESPGRESHFDLRSVSGKSTPPSAQAKHGRQWNRVVLYVGASMALLVAAGFWFFRHFGTDHTQIVTTAPARPEIVTSAQPKPDSVSDQQPSETPPQSRVEGQSIWDEAMKHLNADDLDAAEQSFRKVLASPDAAGRRTEATRYLVSVIPARRQEAATWAKAVELAKARDTAQLQESIRLLDSVVTGGGTHAADALRLRDKTMQDLARAETSARLTDATQKHFAELEDAFRQAKQQGDSKSLSQLRTIQDGFRVIAESGGPLAPGAADYQNNVIPATIKQIEDRLAASEAQSHANAQFDDAVSRYNQAIAAKDLATLKSQVLPLFVSIARSGGPKASEAARYADSTIPEDVRKLTPWPAVGCPASPIGLEQAVKPGEMVACSLLDPPKLRWAQFSWPEFPSGARQAGLEKGTAMLSLTVDENGNIVEARPRGPADAHGFTDAALSAAKQWRTTTPRAQGKPVRTQFAVDIPFQR